MTNREYDRALIGLRLFLYGNKPRKIESTEHLLPKLNMVVPHLQTVIEANSDTPYGDGFILRKHLNHFTVSGRVTGDTVDLSVNQHLPEETVVALVFMPRAEHIKTVLCSKESRKIARSLTVAMSDRTTGRSYLPLCFAWSEMDPEDLRFIWGTEPAKPDVVRSYTRLLNTGIACLLKVLERPSPVPKVFYR